MTSQQMVEDMIKMQRALDKAIYDEHKVSFNEEKCKLAMIDEIGEFNHELKATWCWWKKTQAPVDRDKALEELVDIWHFALSLTYHKYDMTEKDLNFNQKFYPCTEQVSSMYDFLLCDSWNRLDWLYHIGRKFDFTLEEVYEMYKKKNQVNYERLANKY